jgi:hypothetical protein
MESAQTALKKTATEAEDPMQSFRIFLYVVTVLLGITMLLQVGSLYFINNVETYLLGNIYIVFS